MKSEFYVQMPASELRQIRDNNPWGLSARIIDWKDGTCNIEFHDLSDTSDFGQWAEDNNVEYSPV